jgi:uncharacterized delta-60 repeat protein
MNSENRRNRVSSALRLWHLRNHRRLRPLCFGLEDRVLLSGAGDLDTGFASNGVEQITFVPPVDLTSSGQSGNGVAIDYNGDIVAAGTVNSDPGSNPHGGSTIAGQSAAVARLTPNGSPDSNFSSAPVGQLIINTVGSGHYQNKIGPTDYFNSVVQDRNGNILLSNASDNIQIGANTDDLVLAGYHHDGGDLSVDPGEFSVVALTSAVSGQFADDYPITSDQGDTQGLAISFSALSTSKDNGDDATAALLQPDGTVLVTGSSGATNDQIPLARLNFALDLNTNFIELDTSFGSQAQPGTELLDIPGDNAGSQFLLPDGIAAMAFQGSGKIILAGTATNSTGSALILVRLLTSNDTSDPTDDTIDPTFGTNGVELVQVPSGGTASGLAVDPASGRIVVSGSNYLAVMTASGAPDSTFGPSHNGLVSLSGLTGASVALQSDGKIVVAGTAASSGHTTAALARYTSGGVLDTTFGSSGTGVVTTDVDSSGQSGYFGVAIDPSNDKIVVTGSAGAAGTASQTAVVARYIGEAPDITQLSPSSANQGGASFTLTVTGANFVNGSAILWNGAALTTTFASATGLTAIVPASDLAQSGTANVTVSNPGNITSNAETFTINAVPGITGLSPASANEGGASFTLTVTGANFVNGSAILWNGAALTTTFVSATSLTATVPASDLAQSGTSSVTVSNPGNIKSNAKTFTINAVPGITQLSPTSANQSGASFTLTVTGANFVNGSAILWNGAALTTTFVSTTSLTAIVPASDLAQSGTASVTVSNPGNITSKAKTFTINAVPGITGLSPASAIQGGSSFTLTVTGANFVNGSAILWNGAALATTFVSTTSLTATVPASDLAQSGTASVTASNPGNIKSNALTFTINAVNTTPSITWSKPGAITFGTALSSTQLDAIATVSGTTIDGTYMYAPSLGTILHAGAHQPLSVTFTPSPATGYTMAATDTVYIDVNKFVPVLTLMIGSPTYDGSPHPAPLNITAIDDDDLASAVTVTYNGSSAAPVNAGDYTVDAAFPGNSDCDAVSLIKQLTIAKATPVIAWANPAPINAGTPLGGAQLDAHVSSVSGTLTYSPTANTVLPAGSGELLSVRFSPDDTSDYESVTAQVVIDVLLPPPPPHVTLIAAAGHTKKGLTAITVTFDESMNPGSVMSAGDYTLRGEMIKKKHPVFNKPVPIRRVTYNDSTHTATITFSKPYKGVVQATVKSGIVAANGLTLGTTLPTNVK